MEFIIVSHQELSALRGLPYLQQLTYLQGIKPYVDYKTGLVGIRRGISYQSLSEALYIEPHQGIKSGSPSKDQLRRVLKGLEKAGLLEIKSWERKLVFRCLLLESHTFVQNKPAIKAPDEVALDTPQTNNEKSINYSLNPQKEVTLKSSDPATPQYINNNYFIFLFKAFEEFWDLYPLKKEKENALEVLKKLKPSQELMDEIKTRLQQQIQFHQQQQAKNIWMPAWKYPANWLAQRGWETTSTIIETKEYEHAIHEANRPQQSTAPNTVLANSSENTSFNDAEFQKLWKLH